MQKMAKFRLTHVVMFYVNRPVKTLKQQVNYVLVVF